MRRCSAVVSNALWCVWNDVATGRVDVLVATDLAARGLDFSTVSHVVVYDMPDSVEEYLHRIGTAASSTQYCAACSDVACVLWLALLAWVDGCRALHWAARY